MSVKIEYEEKGTRLSYPDNIGKMELLMGISCIYLHAKAQLETLSTELGIDLVKAATEKINQVG